MAAMSHATSATAIILVDHGSTRAESNDLLLETVLAYRRRAPAVIVEAAHMELAEPTLAAAFDRCVAQGARFVTIVPYFLGPGKHLTEDIPRLAAEAARPYEDVRYVVARPLGGHPWLLEVIEQRVAEAAGRQHCGATAENRV
jgi:sirohydrochlorin ferrochelatase